MIITCPHCQTKYQVTYEAIGSAGRKVQCAHCQQAWQQVPLKPEAAEPPPTPQQQAATTAIEEDALDEALETEARAAAPEGKKPKARDAAPAESNDVGKVDPAVIRMRQRAFSRRQNAVSERMPFARLRRAARLLGLLLLAAVLATAWFGRVQVVEQFPAMAGVYEALGMGVNVVGLDFSNVSTLQTLRDGKEVLIISAQIVGLLPEPVHVPPVVITLLDSHGAPVYEWSVTPSVRDLMATERATFDTQLTLPPGEAARVRMSFAGGAPPREAAVVPPDEAPAHAEPAAAEHPAEPEHIPAPEHH